MKDVLCTGSIKREPLAIGLSFGAAVIMSLEALHPGACVFFDLNADQYFAMSALLATASAFLGGYILSRAVVRLTPAV